MEPLFLNTTSNKLSEYHIKVRNLNPGHFRDHSSPSKTDQVASLWNPNSVNQKSLNLIGNGETRTLGSFKSNGFLNRLSTFDTTSNLQEKDKYTGCQLAQQAYIGITQLSFPA